jgi:hypothetical protein
VPFCFLIASLEVLMPGTKINGLFGFNRLSSDILFDICIEKTQSAISFCQSIASFLGGKHPDY